MSIVKDFRSYLLEDNLKINVYEKRVNIINYISINHFDDNLVIIKYNNGFIDVNGTNLVVTKLLSDELLIEGKIRSVELKWKI